MIGAGGFAGVTSGPIVVLEAGCEISFSYQDMLKYHGGRSPGGVAHAFKVLERALTLLDGGGGVERRAIFIETAFGGPGARDAFELVTRAVGGLLNGSEGQEQPHSRFGHDHGNEEVKDPPCARARHRRRQQAGAEAERWSDSSPTTSARNRSKLADGTGRRSRLAAEVVAALAPTGASPASCAARAAA